jgi:glycosyltransferase involved in cell wall biosynthesis
VIVFVHLLNDRSGSPRVLSSVIKALSGSGQRLRLFIGSDGSGCLDEVDVEKTRYWYWRTPYRLLTLATYLVSQCLLFFRLLLARDIDWDAVIYVNTLLPFGASLYAKITGRRLITHVHEISVSPTPLRWLLTGIARLCSDLTIYVSDAHREALPIHGVPYRRIYNALDPGFIRQAAASTYRWQTDGRFTVLMIASLRDYKGVPELLAVADGLATYPHIRFELVVNDGPEDIASYFADRPLPPNLQVHPRVDDTKPFYGRASIVLNLSRVDQWVETFGLTILEAMAFGIPVIVPPVGGPLELVQDGVQGFQLDSRRTDAVQETILRLSQDEASCLRLSAAARVRAACFSPDSFNAAVLDALAQVRSA